MKQKVKVCRNREAKTKVARNATWVRTCSGTVPSAYKALLILMKIHEAVIPGNRPSQQRGG